MTVIVSPCCSTTTSSACLPSTTTMLSVVSVQRTLTLPLLISTTRLTGVWVSKRYSGMACLLQWVEGVLIHAGRRRCRSVVVLVGWGQTQPVIRRLPRLPSEGALSAERVVAADEREAGQVDVDVDRVVAGGGADDVDQPGVERVPRPGRELLGLGLDPLGEPQRDPGDAALLLVLDARRRGRSRAGPAARAGRAAPSTTNASSRPSSRTSTPPAGISAVISVAACEMASISASRAAGSRAKVSRSAAAWTSGPAASAAASRSRRRLSTYGVMSMCTIVTPL